MQKCAVVWRDPAPRVPSPGVSKVYGRRVTGPRIEHDLGVWRECNFGHIVVGIGRNGYGEGGIRR
jgi:hypothetical protein